MIAHKDGLRIAGRLAGALWDAAERMEIVGSVRRGKPNVQDVELLIIPKPELWARLDEWAERGFIRPRKNKAGRNIAWDGYKQRAIEAYVLDTWVAVDLFFAEPETFAVSELIRTGDADFSKGIVTPVTAGGALPPSLSFKDWKLWTRSGVALPLRREVDIFRAYGLPFIAPYKRTIAELRRWAKFSHKQGGKVFTFRERVPPSLYQDTSSSGSVSSRKWYYKGRLSPAPKGYTALLNGALFVDGGDLSLTGEARTLIDMYLAAPAAGSGKLWAGERSAESLIYSPPDKRGTLFSLPTRKVIEWSQ